MSTGGTFDESQVNTDGEFRILIASDIHLGFQDRSTERRLDSINAFDEVLQIAHEQDAHIALLAGDLFHVNDPPKWVVKESIRLLRKHCYGDRDIDFRLSSDQSRNFSDSDFPVVNYEDPNVNVSLPVFTIHGNHDDPVGVQHESVVKLLATTGLINYFGRVKDYSEIELEPLLFERGRNKIAVFGLGAMRDERLHTLFREGKVHFKRPPNPDRWFKMLLLHQNRHKRGPGNYIPDTYLPKDLDLVVWGHEHECLMDFQFNGHFRILQPGSTVATSLCPGEVPEKGVGLLKIMFDKSDRKHKCSIDKIPLKTVRQLYVEDISLSELPPSKSPLLERELEFLQERIEEIVEKAVGERSGHPKQPKKPLVRLRVLYGPDHETFLPHFVGRHFKEKIANPGECIHFVRDRELWSKDRNTGVIDEEKFMDVVEEQKKSHAKIEDMLNAYFKNAADENARLHVMHEDAFSRAIQLSVEKGNAKEIVHKLVEESAKRMKARLMQADDANDEPSMLQYLRECKTEKTDEFDEDVKHVIKELNTLPSNVKTEDIDDSDVTQTTPATGRGRGRGRGRGKTVSPAQIRDSNTVIDDSDDEFNVPLAPTRGRGRGRGRGAATTSKAAKSKSVIEDSDDDDFGSFVAPTQNSSKSRASQRSIVESFASSTKTRGRKRAQSPDIEEDAEDDVIPSSQRGSSTRNKSQPNKKTKRVDVFAMLDDMD